MFNSLEHEQFIGFRSQSRTFLYIIDLELLFDTLAVHVPFVNWKAPILSVCVFPRNSVALFISWTHSMSATTVVEYKAQWSRDGMWQSQMKRKMSNENWDRMSSTRKKGAKSMDKTRTWNEDILNDSHVLFSYRCHSKKSPVAHNKQTHFSLFFFSLVVTFRRYTIFSRTTPKQTRKNEERKNNDQKTNTKPGSTGIFRSVRTSTSVRGKKTRAELSSEKCQCTELYLFHLALFPVVYSLNEKLKWKQENGDLDGNQFTFEHLFLFVLASHFRMNDDKNVHKNTQRGREWARDTGERRKRAMSATKWKAWIDKWIFSSRAHIKHFHFSGV